MDSRLFFRVIALRSAVIIGAAVLGGCNSTPQTSNAASNAQEGEYVTYQPTGSMLPRRVKKSQVPAEYLTVENSDSPTLQQMEKKQLIGMTPKSR